MDDYVEKLLGVIGLFEYEYCCECGRDINEHMIGPDILGNPHAFCLQPTDEEI